jgi:hypothetical protein
VFWHQLLSSSSAIIISTWEISYRVSIVWNCYIVDLSEVSCTSLDDTTTTTTLNTCCLISCEALNYLISTKTCLYPYRHVARKSRTWVIHDITQGRCPQRPIGTASPPSQYFLQGEFYPSKFSCIVGLIVTAH